MGTLIAAGLGRKAMASILNGPDARSVATRAIILKYVVVTAAAAPPRGFSDHWSSADRDNFAKMAENKRLEVLDSLGTLKSALTPWEQSYFSKSAATLSRQQQVDAGWRLESFRVLLWALNVTDELLPYDVEAPVEVLRSYPKGGVEASVSSATLRATEAVEEQRSIAELWHWRSRTRELVERGETPPAEIREQGFKTFDDIVRAAATLAANNGVTTLVNGDFSLKGKAYRELNNEEWFEVRSIASERHFALNWLCGYAPSNHWDETPTDT
jgi:hypothetical protein